MTDGIIRLTYQGQQHEVDLSKLTFGEGRALERVTGRSISDLAKPDMTTMQGIVWIALKRSNPDLKFSDLDDLPLDALDIEADPTTEPENPTPPAAE